MQVTYRLSKKPDTGVSAFCSVRIIFSVSESIILNYVGRKLKKLEV